MKPQSFSVSVVLPATPEEIYKAWMSGPKHAEMTGGAARINAKVGGAFSAWDGYIQGKTLELEPYTRIVQAWRTSEFPEDAPDSRLEILLKKEKKGARVTLNHSEIPPGQGALYKKGWKDFYFKPMKEYFKGA